MDIKLQRDWKHSAWCPRAALGMAPDSHSEPKHLSDQVEGSGQRDGLIPRF